MRAPRLWAKRPACPRISGLIEFDQVSFRYRSDTPDVIRCLNLKIAPGEVIGIVGRSGFGKSTLAKLIQRLYVPDRGRLHHNGQDMAVMSDTVSLRHQIGVVLQENVLFNRSIRDNIALSNPSLSIEAIIGTAKLAGAPTSLSANYRRGMTHGWGNKVQAFQEASARIAILGP